MPFAKRVVKSGENLSVDADSNISDSEDIVGLRYLCTALQSLVLHANSLWEELLNECIQINSRTQRVKSRIDQLAISVNKLNARAVPVPAGSLTRSSPELEPTEESDISSSVRYLPASDTGSNLGSATESLFIERRFDESNIFTENTRPVCVRLLHQSSETSPLKVIRQCWRNRRLENEADGSSAVSVAGPEDDLGGLDETEREIGDDELIYGSHVFSPVLTINRNLKRESDQRLTKSFVTVPSLLRASHRPLREPKISASSSASSSQPAGPSTSLQELSSTRDSDTGYSTEGHNSPERWKSQPSVLVAVNTSGKAFIQQTILRRSFRSVHEQPVEYESSRRGGGSKPRRHSAANVPTGGVDVCNENGIVPKISHTDVLRSASRERWLKAYAGDSTDYTADYSNVVTLRGAKKRSKLRRLKQNQLCNNEDDTGTTTCDWRRSICLLVKTAKADLSEDSLWIERRPAVSNSTVKQIIPSSERSQSLPRSFKSNVTGSTHKRVKEHTAEDPAIVSRSILSVLLSQSTGVLSGKSTKPKSLLRTEKVGPDARFSGPVFTNLTDSGRDSESDRRSRDEHSVTTDHVTRGIGDSCSASAEYPETRAESVEESTGVATANHTHIGPASSETVEDNERIPAKSSQVTQLSGLSNVVTVHATIEGRTSSQLESRANDRMEPMEGTEGEDWSFGEVVSLNSVDQDGFYTSMHTDSGLNTNPDLMSHDFDAFDNFSFSSFASTDLGLHGSPLFPRDSRVRGSSQVSDQSSALLNLPEIRYVNSDNVSNSNSDANINRGVATRFGRKASLDGGSSPSHDGSVTEAAILQLTTIANNNAAGFLSLCAITPTNSDDEDNMDIHVSTGMKPDQNTLRSNSFLKPVNTVVASSSHVRNAAVVTPSRDLARNAAVVTPSRDLARNVTVVTPSRDLARNVTVVTPSRDIVRNAAVVSPSVDVHRKHSSSKAPLPPIKLSTLDRNTPSGNNLTQQGDSISTWSGTSSVKSPLTRAPETESSRKLFPDDQQQPDQKCIVKLPPNSVNFSELQFNSEVNSSDVNPSSVSDTESTEQKVDKQSNAMSSFKSYTSDRWRQTLSQNTETDTDSVPYKYRPIIVVRPKQREREKVDEEDMKTDDFSLSTEISHAHDSELCKISAESDTASYQSSNIMLPVSARLVITAPVTKQTEYIKNPFRRSVCSPVSPEQLRKFSVVNQKEDGKKSAFSFTEATDSLSDYCDSGAEIVSPAIQFSKMGRSDLSTTMAKSNYSEHLKSSKMSNKNGTAFGAKPCNEKLPSNSIIHAESYINYSLPREISGNITSLSNSLSRDFVRNVHSCSNSLTKNESRNVQSCSSSLTRQDSRNSESAKLARHAFIGDGSNAAITGLAAEQFLKERPGFSPRLKERHAFDQSTCENLVDSVFTCDNKSPSLSHSSSVTRRIQKQSILESDSSGIGSSVSASPLTSPSTDLIPSHSCATRYASIKQEMPICNSPVPREGSKGGFQVGDFNESIESSAIQTSV